MRRTSPVLFAALFVFAFAGSGCAWMKAILGTQRPTFTYRDVTLDGWSFDSVQIGVAYDIENPYDVPLELAEVNYQLDVGGRRLFRGSPNQGVKVPAGSTKRVIFPATVRFTDILPAATAIFTKNGFDYRAHGDVGIDTPVGILRFPISKSGEVSYPDPPKIELLGLEAPKISATGASLALSLKVSNPNGFPMPLESLQYGLSLNGSKVGTGSARPGTIAGGRSQQLRIPVNVSFADAGRALRTLLDGNPATVGFDGKADLGKLLAPFQASKKLKLAR